MADPAGAGEDGPSEVQTLYGEYRNSRGVVRSLIRDCRDDYNRMRTHQERIVVSKRERRPITEIRAICHERDACRQSLDGHLDELRAAQNAHTTDITDIIDALEPFVADDLDDPENASSLDSDSINTQLGSRGSGNVADIQDFDDGIEGGDEDDDDDDDDASPAPDGVGALDTTTTTTTTEDGAAEGVVDAQAIEVGRVGGPPPSPVNLPALEVLALVGSPPVLEPHPEVKQEIADHHLAIVVLGSDDDGVNQNAGDGEPAGDDGAAPTEPMENFIAPAPQFIRPPVGGPIYVTSVVGPGGEVLAQYELDGRHCAPPSGNVPARIYLFEGVPIPQALFRDRATNTIIQLANVRPESVPPHLVLLFPIIEMVNPAPYGFRKDGTPAAKRGRKRRR